MRQTKHEIARVLRIAAAIALLAGAAACATERSKAEFPAAAMPCPPWLEFPADRYSDQDHTYFGCSNSVNLKTGLEDGRDLERGRDLGPASGARESIAAGQYESGQTKPLQSNGPPTPTIVFSGSNGGGQ